MLAKLKIGDSAKISDRTAYQAPLGIVRAFNPVTFVIPESSHRSTTAATHRGIRWVTLVQNEF